MSKSAKKRLYRIIVSAVILAVGLALEHLPFLKLSFPIYIFIYLAGYFIAGYDVLGRAASNIKSGMLLDENFLMGLATIGALCIGEYSEAVAVMVFYQTGELFSDIAVNRSRKSLKALMNLRPDSANLLVGDDEIKVVKPEEVQVDDIILVRPGERIPLDGIILSGSSAIDVSAVLGESIPEEAVAGDKVTGGCIAKNGTLKIKVTTKYADSTVAKIIAMGEMASMKKSKQESFVTRFARVYTPVVVGLAAAIAFLPPIFGLPFETWFYRGLMFLVVSCPCALVVSVPLSFFCAMGGASKCGILVKGSQALESLSEVDTVCFDKTGTLTDGKFTVTDVKSEKMPREEFLDLAAAIEKESSHPIAQSIVKVGNPDKYTVEAHENHAGKGVCSTIDGVRYYAGTARWMKELGVKIDAERDGVYIAREQEYLGYLNIGDSLKPEAETALEKLRALGVRRTALLTGGSEETAQAACKALKINYHKSTLLPEQKLGEVENLLNTSTGGKLAYVGDGINDVPVLARADVGVSMGVVGSDAAIEASDVVLMHDNLSSLATAIRIGKRTVNNARFNIIMSIVVKVGVMVLSVLGLSDMWIAIFADVGVCVLAVANATRMLSVKEK